MPCHPCKTDILKNENNQDCMELCQVLSALVQLQEKEENMTNREAHEKAADMAIDGMFFAVSNIDPDAEYVGEVKVGQQMETCKFCGAKIENKKAIIDFTRYECGSVLWSQDYWQRMNYCYERQLEQSEDRAKELYRELAYVGNCRVPDNYDWYDIAEKAFAVVQKHADHFSAAAAYNLHEG
jgi:hypothetical protein